MRWISFRLKWESGEEKTYSTFWEMVQDVDNAHKLFAFGDNGQIYTSEEAKHRGDKHVAHYMLVRHIEDD